MIAAIVPAGGASERMGVPKALLSYRGRTFLRAILDACAALGVKERIVVLGYDADKILSESDLNDVAVLRTPSPESGPIGSIRAGIEAVLNRPVEGVLVWHVDRPHVAMATVEALLDRFRRGKEPIVVPSHHGRRGHPVIFGRAVFEELLAVPDDQGARAVVRSDPSRVAVVPVDDSAVTEDIDTPEAYKDLLRREDTR
ncbi:MAG: NTP transferase domain-containing protein [Gemmatimonadales bacterium]|nr:NTP transferase domain-containing protein [Gemmatimonadales bacterium]